MQGHMAGDECCDVFLQELLMRVGALGHIVPLLFGYDATHDAESQPDHFDYTGTHKAQGPAFLGLAIQRSNIQVPSLHQPSSESSSDFHAIHRLGVCLQLYCQWKSV